MKVGLVRVLGAIAMNCCVATASMSADFPHQFIGIWTLATETENQCKKSDWENNKNDGMASVAANSIEYWESSCKVLSVKKLDDSTYELGLTCRGEGQSWRSKEVWHMARIASRNQLVAVSLDTFDERDETSGKKLKSISQHKIKMYIYLECR